MKSVVVDEKGYTSESDNVEGLTDKERCLYESIPGDVDFVYHESFAFPGTEQELFGDGAERIEVSAWCQFPAVPDEVPTSLAGRTTLTASEEANLFLRYNYARHKLSLLLAMQRRAPAAVRAKEMTTWHKRAMTARVDLVRANMALVLAMAKRTRASNVEFSELISEGNLALLRSVEKFDVARGFKFSTYACRSILKSFNRLKAEHNRYRQHFPKQFDPQLERSGHEASRHEVQWGESLDSLRRILSDNSAQLTDTERTIVMERFAFASRGKGRTLSEVGRMIGLTDERVRQIQNLALNKIRSALVKEIAGK